MDRELLYVFGTGNATVTNLYNTCFALRDSDEYFMVDAGGGNGILKILDNMQVSLSRIHHIFVTHEHTDHVLGIIWMIRMIATKMRQDQYDGDAFIYCHEELVETIKTLCRTKARQFGFTLTLNNGRRLTCLGDEPFNPACERYLKGCDWLLHEAFCLYVERDVWKPYEKHHSTVKDACELAEAMQIPNLVLWHTEDSNVAGRERLYKSEGKRYYSGNIYVPDDESLIAL